MNCVYHPINPAHVRCGSCGRYLCPACDHRIKGSPHCQDCIVAGVEMLRRAQANGRSKTRARRKSAGVAMLLALIPGLGAAYNGQNIKALLHFAVTAGLWHLTDIMSAPFSPLFLLAGIAFYLYSIYDAKQSADRQREGEDLQIEDQKLKHSLRERAPVWGGIILGVGVISFLHIVFDAQMQGLWPLLLIGAGVYLLRGFQRLSRPGKAEPSTYQTPPPSVIGSPYERRTGDYSNFEARRYDQGR